MIGSLFVPETACPHPIDRLRCDLRSPAWDIRPESVRAVIQCLTCIGFWTPHTAHITVIDKLRELLDQGAYAVLPNRL